MNRILAFVIVSTAMTSVNAKPVTTTPTRERARCQAEVDLCDRVARDDYNRCVGAGQSGCADNYYEDVNECTADYNDCLGSIKAILKPIGGVVGGGEVGVIAN